MTIGYNIRSMSPAAFAKFGLDQTAYVKTITVDGANGYAVHLADGSRVAVLTDRDHAFAAVRQHDLEPVSVH